MVMAGGAMSGLPPPLPKALCSPETENGLRLMQLLRDLGLSAIHKVLETKSLSFHGKRAFGDVLLDPVVQDTLEKLVPQPLSRSQWKICYGRGHPNFNAAFLGKIADFDISLATLLLRNICGLLPTSNKIWDKKPTNIYNCYEECIASIKWYRNYMSHHPSGEIRESDFNVFFGHIKQAILRISNLLNTPSWSVSSADIDKFKTDNISKKDKQDLKELRKKWSEEISDVEKTLNNHQQMHDTTHRKLEAISTKQSEDSSDFSEKLDTILECVGPKKEKDMENSAQGGIDDQRHINGNPCRDEVFEELSEILKNKRWRKFLLQLGFGLDEIIDRTREDEVPDPAGVVIHFLCIWWRQKNFNNASFDYMLILTRILKEMGLSDAQKQIKHIVAKHSQNSANSQNSRKKTNLVHFVLEKIRKKRNSLPSLHLGYIKEENKEEVNEAVGSYKLDEKTCKEGSIIMDYICDKNTPLPAVGEEIEIISERLSQIFISDSMKEAAEKEGDFIMVMAHVIKLSTREEGNQILNVITVRAEIYTFPKIRKNAEISDFICVYLAENVGNNWKKIAQKLSVDTTDEIEQKYVNQQEQAMLEALEIWRKSCGKEGREAIEFLITTLLESDMEDLASKIEKEYGSTLCPWLKNYIEDDTGTTSGAVAPFAPTQTYSDSCEDEPSPKREKKEEKGPPFFQLIGDTGNMSSKKGTEYRILTLKNEDAIVKASLYREGIAKHRENLFLGSFYQITCFEECKVKPKELDEYDVPLRKIIITESTNIQEITGSGDYIEKAVVTKDIPSKNLPKRINVDGVISRDDLTKEKGIPTIMDEYGFVEIKCNNSFKERLLALCPNSLNYIRLGHMALYFNPYKMRLQITNRVDSFATELNEKDHIFKTNGTDFSSVEPKPLLVSQVEEYFLKEGVWAAEVNCHICTSINPDKYFYLSTTKCQHLVTEIGQELCCEYCDRSYPIEEKKYRYRLYFGVENDKNLQTPLQITAFSPCADKLLADISCEEMMAKAERDQRNILCIYLKNKTFRLLLTKGYFERKPSVIAHEDLTNS